MKKNIWMPACLSLAMFLAACGGGEKKAEEKKAEESTAPAADNSMVQDVAGKGKELMAAQDCATCHKETEKVIGPSFKEVAAKYPATDENIATLADKIIKGGSGNWGEVPMAPHSAISQDDAKEMVKYILSVK
ncbi:cytochrome C [Chitinophaga lutea]|uniref:Cytochrome C n=1 Tax=Chitinophaga lutea TaxID=2488634 RepID=A0A3N4PYC8_9BACT|nr:c-type cytochrome [Chitinophaga lutea]RPE12916.1 cytochrome C [Chitinophaga lutea]